MSELLKEVSISFYLFSSVINHLFAKKNTKYPMKPTRKYWIDNIPYQNTVFVTLTVNDLIIFKNLLSCFHIKYKYQSCIYLLNLQFYLKNEELNMQYLLRFSIWFQKLTCIINRWNLFSNYSKLKTIYTC